MYVNKYVSQQILHDQNETQNVKASNNLINGNHLSSSGKPNQLKSSQVKMGKLIRTQSSFDFQINKDKKQGQVFSAEIQHSLQ